MKRRFLSVFLALTLCFSTSACGGQKRESVEKEPEAEVAEEVEEVLPITTIDGDWNCIDMSVSDNGTEMTAADMEGLFGMSVEEMAHVSAFSDGTADLLLLGEAMAASWTEADGKYTVTPIAPEGEEVSEDMIFTGEVVNEQLILTQESVYTMDDVEVKSVSTYTFAYNGKISKILPGWDFEISDEEVLAISNFMADNNFVVVGDDFYGCFGGAEYGQGAFTVAKLVSGDVPELKDSKVIAEAARPMFLSEHDGYIYGILEYNKIIKLKAGEDTYDVIYEGACDYLQVVGDEIRFADENYKYCSIGLDGGEKTVLIDQEEMYYPHTLSNNMVIYQNDPDNESIHIYDQNTGTDYKVNDEVSYQPMLYGDYIYYYVVVDDERSMLKRVNMYSGAVEEAPDSLSFSYYIMNDQLVIGGLGGLPVVSMEEWTTYGEAGNDIYTMYPQYSNGDICVGKYSDGEIFILNDFADLENKVKIGYNYVAK